MKRIEWWPIFIGIPWFLAAVLFVIVVIVALVS